MCRGAVACVDLIRSNDRDRTQMTSELKKKRLSKKLTLQYLAAKEHEKNWFDKKRSHLVKMVVLCSLLLCVAELDLLIECMFE